MEDDPIANVSGPRQDQWTGVSQVLDNLFLCGHDDFHTGKLRKYGITLVINMTRDLSNKPAPGVRFQRFATDDISNENIKRFFHRATDAIHAEIQRGGKVLVHCLAGVSRSPTIILAYLIKYRKMTLSDALDLVRACRGIISPNHGFLQQLEEFEKEMNKCCS